MDMRCTNLELVMKSAGIALALAVIALSGCVVVPAGPGAYYDYDSYSVPGYYPGYYYDYGYAGPSVGFFFSNDWGGWHGHHWGGHHWDGGWRGHWR
jgi:hypothetical protein